MQNGNVSGEFYEVSRRNVAILLIFWISYITAYIICACLVAPYGETPTSLARRRRSNLSRLMLLNVLGRRTRSLPPSRSSSYTSPSRAASIEDISESEGRGMSDSELGTTSNEDTNSEVYHFGSHTLSSFVFEYTIGVMSVAVIIQGFFLIPISMLSLVKIYSLIKDWRWQWLSLALVQKWWAWLWILSVFLLFMGLPIALILVEGKEYRNAPIFKKILLIVSRLLRNLARFGFAKSLFGLTIGIGLYIFAVLTQLIHPLNIESWIHLINVFWVGMSAIGSIVCISLGFGSFVTISCSSLCSPSIHQFLHTKKQELDKQILDLEGSLWVSHPSRTTEPNSTPISSKSARSRLVELKLQSVELKKQLAGHNHSRLYRLLKVVVVVVSLIWLYYFVISIGVQFWKFFASKILWYFPGVQTVDWLLFKVASTIKMVETPERMETNHWMTFLNSTLSCLSFSILFAQGLNRLVTRRARRVTLVLDSPNQFFQRRRLDQFLPSCAVLLTCTTLSSTLISVSGAIDAFESTIITETQISHYQQKIIILFPAIQQRLVFALHSITFLRFPLLVWLVLLYRGLLFTTLLFVALNSIRPTLRSFRAILWRTTRTTPKLFVHSHID